MTQIERSSNPRDIYRELKTNLRAAVPESVVPDFELEIKAELIAKIETLKRQKNAVILGHNYMEPVLFHTIPDYRGDSLELSRRAAETDADIIVFCGVHFMAETAKILNPGKKVLIPSRKAGCSLAEGINPEDVLWLKSQFPRLPVVTYINSTAAVKAVSDVCCTSGNARAVIRWAQEYFSTPSVIFLPDKYLARNLANELEMDFYLPDKNKPVMSEVEITNHPTVVGWHARCYVHEQYTPDHVRAIRSDYPGAIVLAHPECPPEVIREADFSGSTSGMSKFVEQNGRDKKIALLTECSMADNIIANHPELNDNLIRMCNLRCRYMHTITLEQTYSALVHEQFEINLPESIRKAAEVAVRRMIAFS